MKLKGLGILFLIGILYFIPVVSKAQDTGDPDKVGAPNVVKGGKDGPSKHKLSSQEKKAADTKERQMKEAAKAEKEAAKFHEKIQSKQTREMMKASRDKADAYNGNKRAPWWKRLFMKKKP